jgi:hypothetical protein
MSKYESAKAIEMKKARVAHQCEACGRNIEKGQEYFRESLGLVAKPPGLHLRCFCIGCGEKYHGQ